MAVDAGANADSFNLANCHATVATVLGRSMQTIWAAAAVLMLATPASAGAIAGSYGTFGLQATDPAFHGGTPLRSTHHSAAMRKLRDLREEGLAMQEADGGKLTDEHRAYLQGKLDAITAELKAEREPAR
jgi:hypothetical protein